MRSSYHVTINKTDIRSLKLDTYLIADIKIIQVLMGLCAFYYYFYLYYYLWTFVRNKLDGWMDG